MKLEKRREVCYETCNVGLHAPVPVSTSLHGVGPSLMIMYALIGTKNFKPRLFWEQVWI